MEPMTTEKGKVNQTQTDTILNTWCEQEFGRVVMPAHGKVVIEKAPEDTRDHIVTVGESFKTQQAKSLLLMGPVGSGKTSIMAILYRYLLDAIAVRSKEFIVEHPGEWRGNEYYMDDGQYRSVFSPSQWMDSLYTNHSYLIAMLREVSDSEYRPVIRHKKFVFLDDFGRVYMDKSGWNMSLQEEWFDYRWGHRLPTVITTNWGPKDMADIRAGKKERDWQRICDRLWDGSWMARLVINRPSMRK